MSTSLRWPSASASAAVAADAPSLFGVLLNVAYVAVAVVVVIAEIFI